MKYATSRRFDRSVDEVIAAVTDFAVVKAKYEALGHRDVELLSREEGADGSITVSTKRVIPLDVPGFAKKVLKPSNTSIQVDRWSAPDATGGRSGTFSVDAKGVPVDVAGTMRLEPTADGCDYRIEVEVTCKVPLIGGKIADFVGGDARKAVDHDLAFTAQHLG